MCDLGFAMKVVLVIDAKATEHLLHRQGIVCMKDSDVALLWVQDEVRSNRLKVRRSQCGKALCRAAIARHAVQMKRLPVSSRQQHGSDHVKKQLDKLQMKGAQRAAETVEASCLGKSDWSRWPL